MLKTASNFIIPDDLSIPAFLIRKPGEKRLPTPKIRVHEEQNPKSAFVPVVLPEKPKNLNKPKGEFVSVQERLRLKASWHIAELEGMIDDKAITPDWSLYDHARKQEWSTKVAVLVANHFVPVANELLEVISFPDDTDLQEAYDIYTQDEIADMAVMYQGLVDEANRYAINFKKLKVRKKKLPSVERVLKHFVYAKSDETYKLASIDPATIIGASELWVFYPKSKTLSVYRALDRGGLGIKRTTITNIDEKTSVSKSMGRKTEERLEKIMFGGRSAIGKLMDSLTGKKKLTRITKNHILLRVVK